jgi:hypothetical protein
MGLCQLLVRQFDSWMESSAAKAMTARAAKLSEREIARTVEMASDRLALSASARKLAAGAEGKLAQGLQAADGKLLAAADVKLAATAAPKAAKKAAKKAVTGALAATAGQPVATTEQLLARRRVAMNRINGDRREKIVQRFLRKRFPQAEGYTVHAEQYLRDKQGRIAAEAASGESRRLDFVVFQGDRVISTVEVTSKTASKAIQSAKEESIRKAGGRYLVNPTTGTLIRLPAGQKTAVLRLE